MRSGHKWMGFVPLFKKNNKKPQKTNKLSFCHMRTQWEVSSPPPRRGPWPGLRCLIPRTRRNTFLLNANNLFYGNLFYQATLTMSTPVFWDHNMRETVQLSQSGQSSHISTRCKKHHTHNKIIHRLVFFLNFFYFNMPWAKKVISNWKVRL
jgi:hypothetical protein